MGVSMCELVGYSQQARRWPVPALAMVPRRGAVCCLGPLLLPVLRLSTFFFWGFSSWFTTVPVDFFFSSFRRIDFDQRIWLLLTVVTNLDFFLYLFAHTNIHRHTDIRVLFSHNHTHTHGHGRAALPYDDGSKQQQNPDDIIIWQHLSRPRARGQTKFTPGGKRGSSFAASSRRIFLPFSWVTRSERPPARNRNAQTHSKQAGTIFRPLAGTREPMFLPSSPTTRHTQLAC